MPTKTTRPIDALSVYELAFHVAQHEQMLRLPILNTPNTRLDMHFAIVRLLKRFVGTS
jgi:hypothetical protein